MLTVIIKKEFISLAFDKRFWLLSIVLLVLLMISLITAKQDVDILNKERSAAQQASRDHWLNQSPKNPHSAAHFGNFAFRTEAPLSLFDAGLDSYTGSYVFLEPHKQNDFKFSQAQDETVISRFSHLTPAFVLQTLLPLLLVFLCFASVTKEREDNTLKLLLAQGCSLRRIVLGKVLGSMAAITLLIVFFFIVSGVSVATIANTNGSHTVESLFLLFFAYFLYTFIWITVAVVISAYSQTSRASLMKLLGAWILACIILPKVSSNIGSNLYQTPSQFQFNSIIHEDEQNGLNGHNPADKRRDTLLLKTLAKYKVDTITNLPVNFDAIDMVEAEKYTTMVYRKRFGEVEQQFEKQNSVSEWCGFINPFQAVQYSSMALCGTDYSHFRHFHQQAENYRLYFVNSMNEFMTTHTKTGDWETSFGRDLYQTIHPFTCTFPGINWSLTQQPVSLSALLFWFIVSGILIYSTRSIRIIK